MDDRIFVAESFRRREEERRIGNFVKKAAQDDEVVLAFGQELDIVFESPESDGYAAMMRAQCLSILSEYIRWFNDSKAVKFGVVREERIKPTTNLKYRSWPVLSE